MGEFPRKADGRRVFTPEFKLSVVQRIQKGEKTLAELSRELDIYLTVILTLKRRYEAGASMAVTATEDVVPASQLRDARQRIRARGLLGRKQMEIEILEAAREVVRKVRGCAKGPGGDRPSSDRDLRDPAHRPADGPPPPAGCSRRRPSPSTSWCSAPSSAV
jgi:transposase